MTTDSKPRVLIVNDHFGHEGGAIHGVTTYFFNILPDIDPARAELSLGILRGPHPAADRFSARAGFEPVFLNRSKWDPRALTDLCRLIRQRGVNVLHLAGMKGILLGRLAGRATGCANLIHLHDTQPPSSMMRRLQASLVPWTDLAVGCSEAVRLRAVRTFGMPADRTRTLYNGLPLERFANPGPAASQNIRRELNIPSDAPLIGLIGRFYPMKGHAKLIEALPRLRRQCPGAMLLLVGDGPTRSLCEEQARRTGFSEAVRFTGHRDDIPQVLAALDLLAMPSLFWEGLPYAAIEAAAAGVPTVAYRAPGVDEAVIDRQTGILVECGEVDRLADAMARVLNDHTFHESLAANARRHAQRFSIHRHVEQLTTIYEELAAQRQRSASRQPAAASVRPPA